MPREMRAQSGIEETASAMITGTAPSPITATSARPSRMAGKLSIMSIRRISQASSRV